MIQNFKVDQARTFGSVLVLGVEAKTAFGDPYRQETTKDGTPKWVAQLAVEFRAFGRSQRELINVGLISEKDPGEGLVPGTPVELLDVPTRQAQLCLGSRPGSYTLSGLCNSVSAASRVQTATALALVATRLLHLAGSNRSQAAQGCR